MAQDISPQITVPGSPAVYKPGPNDPIPQDDRKKWQVQLAQFLQNAGQDVNSFIDSATAPRTDLMQKYLPQLAAEKERAKGVRAESPLLDMILKITDASFGQPGESGKTAGIIAPIANPRLKTLLEGLRLQAPKLMSEAEKASHTVFPYLTPRELMPAPIGTDLVGMLRRSKTLPKSELYVRGGRPFGEQIDTLGHELRHFVTGTNPALMNKPAPQALETAQQLSHMMPAPQQAGMQNYLTGVGTKSLSGRPMDMLKELQGGANNRLPATGQNPALAFDEALSYLTEALLGGNKGGDPALESIAQALGQGLK